MARQFWSEVHDLRAPVGDGLRRSRASRSRRKAVRKTTSTRRNARRVT